MDPLLLCGIFVRVSFRYLYTVCASWETLEIKKSFTKPVMSRTLGLGIEGFMLIAFTVAEFAKLLLPVVGLI